MATVRAAPLPDTALLVADRERGAYVDGYVVDVERVVTHQQLVAAFYTTWLFKVERWILAWAVAKPSTDAQARQLAAGAVDAFAAWTVERRTPDQVLMVDFNGATKSWLMVQPLADAQRPMTRLWFGSAVVARRRSGAGGMPWGYRVLLGFHRLYSRLLLRAAARRVSRCA